ncbi:MAG: TIGR01777 family oxidoreductase [Bacteroidota bacterium]|nr:TIGR01777 family oxidoreductase [Bacteroidota bacterium]
MKKVVIAGGTGFIGTYLTKRFRETGYQVLIISRDPKHVSWEPIDLSESFEGAEMVINLAGKSINCRHTEANKKAILDSRTSATIRIGNAITACKNPPKLWINSSACGIYRASFDQPMTEDETELDNDFLAEVVKKWEKSFFGFQLRGTRKVALRTSVVLGKHGGAFQSLIWLSKLGLGGKQAEGTQIFSWIHIEDYFRILQFLNENEAMQGVLNCTSPDPVNNKEFMNLIRKVLRIPIGIPAPKFAIKLGAKLIGTEPELILKSSFVIPKRLLDSGFKFNFNSAYKALDDLLT